jgi:flagellar hook-basal body complex protein FliE
MMDVRLNQALQAYGSAKSAAQSGAKGAPLADAAASFAETLQSGEAVAMQSMKGGADPHALVEALANTQLAVETAVTVRDRVVEAYQEILRMPV